MSLLELCVGTPPVCTGDTVVVLGRAGCGKTTTVHCMVGSVLRVDEYHEACVVECHEGAAGLTHLGAASRHCHVAQGAYVTFLDTPGYSDETKEEERTLQHELLKRCVDRCTRLRFLVLLDVEEVTGNRMRALKQVAADCTCLFTTFGLEGALRATTFAFKQSDMDVSYANTVRRALADVMKADPSNGVYCAMQQQVQQGLLLVDAADAESTRGRLLQALSKEPLEKPQVKLGSRMKTYLASQKDALRTYLKRLQSHDQEEAIRRQWSLLRGIDTAVAREETRDLLLWWQEEVRTCLRALLGTLEADLKGYFTRDPCTPCSAVLQGHILFTRLRSTFAMQLPELPWDTADAEQRFIASCEDPVLLSVCGAVRGLSHKCALALDKARDTFEETFIDLLLAASDEGGCGRAGALTGMLAAYNSDTLLEELNNKLRGVLCWARRRVGAAPLDCTVSVTPKVDFLLAAAEGPLGAYVHDSLKADIRSFEAQLVTTVSNACDAVLKGEACTDGAAEYWLQEVPLLEHTSVAALKERVAHAQQRVGAPWEPLLEVMREAFAEQAADAMCLALGKLKGRHGELRAAQELEALDASLVVTCPTLDIAFLHAFVQDARSDMLPNTQYCCLEALNVKVKAQHRSLQEISDRLDSPAHDLRARFDTLSGDKVVLEELNAQSVVREANTLLAHMQSFQVPCPLDMSDVHEAANQFCLALEQQLCASEGVAYLYVFSVVEQLAPMPHAAFGDLAAAHRPQVEQLLAAPFDGETHAMLTAEDVAAYNTCMDLYGQLGAMLGARGRGEELKAAMITKLRRLEGQAVAACSALEISATIRKLQDVQRVVLVLEDSPPHGVRDFMRIVVEATRVSVSRKLLPLITTAKQAVANDFCDTDVAELLETTRHVLTPSVRDQVESILQGARSEAQEFVTVFTKTPERASSHDWTTLGRLYGRLERRSQADIAKALHAMTVRLCAEAEKACAPEKLDSGCLRYVKHLADEVGLSSIAQHIADARGKVIAARGEVVEWRIDEAMADGRLGVVKGELRRGGVKGQLAREKVTLLFAGWEDSFEGSTTDWRDEGTLRRATTVLALVECFEVPPRVVALMEAAIKGCVAVLRSCKFDDIVSVAEEWGTAFRQLLSSGLAADCLALLANFAAPIARALVPLLNTYCGLCLEETREFRVAMGAGTLHKMVVPVGLAKGATTLTAFSAGGVDCLRTNEHWEPVVKQMHHLSQYLEGLVPRKKQLHDAYVQQVHKAATPDDFVKSLNFFQDTPVGADLTSAVGEGLKKWGESAMQVWAPLLRCNAAGEAVKRHVGKAVRKGVTTASGVSDLESAMAKMPEEARRLYADEVKKQGVNLSTLKRRLRAARPAQPVHTNKLHVDFESLERGQCHAAKKGMQDLVSGNWDSAVKQFESLPGGATTTLLLAASLGAGKYTEEAKWVLAREPAATKSALGKVVRAMVTRNEKELKQCLAMPVSGTPETKLFHEYTTRVAKDIARGGTGCLSGYPLIAEWEKLIDNFTFSSSEVAPAPPMPDKREAYKFRMECVDAAPSLLELDELEGLATVKKQVEAVVASCLASRKQKPRSIAATIRPFVFVGNPGTGKTTVARIVAKVLHDLGLVDMQKDPDAPNPQQVPSVAAQVSGNPTMPKQPLSGDAWFQHDVDCILADLDGGRRPAAPGARNQPRGNWLAFWSDDPTTTTIGKFGGGYHTTHATLPDKATLLTYLQGYYGDLPSYDSSEPCYEEYERKIKQSLKAHGREVKNSSPLFLETSGGALKTEGPQKFQDMISTFKKRGCVFIDEAYQLCDEGAGVSSGKPILDLLLTAMENNEDMFFILAGYDNEMEKLFDTNPGFRSRVGVKIAFEDYKQRELRNIYLRIMQKEFPRMRVDNEKTLDIWSRRLAAKAGRPSFGNARDVRQAVQQSNDKLLARLPFDASEKDFNILLRRDICGGMPLKRDSKPIVELAGMQGLDSVKQAVIDIAKVLVGNMRREDSGSEARIRPCLHRLFLGNPGTGKTTVAKLLARLLCDMGVMDDDEVVVKTPQDFKGAVVGESEKRTKQILEGCRGKVLFIDEAYAFDDKSDPYYGPVVDSIVGTIHGSPDDPLTLFMAGYRDEMERMLRNVNPGLRSRMQVDSAFVFEDYSKRDLSLILREEVGKQRLATIDRPTTEVATAILEKQKNMPNFGNARQVKELLRNAMLAANSRTDGCADRVQLVAEDFEGQAKQEQRPGQGPGIEDFIALSEWVKGEKRSRERLQRKGREPEKKMLCFVFRGNPGNGKTTAARLMGGALVELGLLGRDTVVEMSASQLQTGFVGQAGVKTRETLDQALGGVLFIDEAYRLDDGNKGYGREILDELVSAVTEDKYKGKLAIVLAGYSQEMQGMLNQNPGLASRFSEVIDFEDFTPERCAELFVAKARNEKQVEVVVGGDTLAALFLRMTNEVHHWANARDVGNFVEHCFRHIDDEDEWRVGDVEACGEGFIKGRPKPNKGAVSRAAAPEGFAVQSDTQKAPPPSPVATAVETELAVDDAGSNGEEDVEEELVEMPPSALLTSLEGIIARLGIPPEEVSRMLEAGKLSPELQAELLREGYTEFEINYEVDQRAEYIKKRNKALKKRGIRTIKYCTVCGRIDCNFRPISFDVEVDL